MTTLFLEFPGSYKLFLWWCVYKHKVADKNVWIIYFEKLNCLNNNERQERRRSNLTEIAVASGGNPSNLSLPFSLPLPHLAEWNQQSCSRVNIGHTYIRSVWVRTHDTNAAVDLSSTASNMLSHVVNPASLSTTVYRKLSTSRYF